MTAAVPSPATSASTRWTPRRLRVANLVVGLVHLAQAAAVLALANGFSVPVEARFQTGAPGSGEGVDDRLFDVVFAPWIAAFLVLAAVDHLLMAAPVVADWYEANLRRGINLARWAEYSVSASIMILLIALLTGITDAYALIAIAGANAAMILFGWLGELAPGERRRGSWRAPFLFGCLAGAVPWICITVSIIGAEANGSVPGFVYGIYVSLFVLFNGFAVNYLLQYRGRGRWADYRFGEAVYILLSLTAKSALAWQVYAGALAS